MRTKSQSGGRNQYYSRYLAYYTKKHYSLLMLGMLFVFGVLLGTLLVRTADSETMDMLLRIINGFMDSRREQTLLQNFISGSSSSLIFLAILFVCGFCAISHPIIILIPLFRGLGFGFSIASLYATQGTQAVGYVALLMLPGTILSTLAIVVCCRESLRLAGSFLAGVGGGSGEKGRKQLYSVRVYIARYFACAVLCLFSAFLEAVLYFGFANSFIFS